MWVNCLSFQKIIHRGNSFYVGFPYGIVSGYFESIWRTFGLFFFRVFHVRDWLLIIECVQACCTFSSSFSVTFWSVFYSMTPGCGLIVWGIWRNCWLTRVFSRAMTGFWWIFPFMESVGFHADECSIIVCWHSLNSPHPYPSDKPVCMTADEQSSNDAFMYSIDQDNYQLIE